MTYENEKWVSGSIKNSEWQHGSGKGLLFISLAAPLSCLSYIFPKKTLKSNRCTGYKFNRHIYIPLNGQTVTNWEILLEFSYPVHDIEVWTVKPTQIDQDGLMWKFTSLDNQVGF